MIAFILRRLMASIGVLIAVGLIAFAMFRFVGDPVNQMVGIETSVREREQLSHQLGLDQPTIVQAARFLVHAARFDFGVSYQFKQPVADLIGARMPATLELALVASILSLATGIPMGVFAALHRDSALARLFQALSLIGISLPTFLIGVLLIYLFAVVLGWLPSFGRGDVVHIGSWWTTGLLTVSGLKSLIMPSVTLALFQMTLIMRLVRAEMLEVMRSDYIRFARARGLSEGAIHFHHALRNTLVPVITVVGLQVGSILAFSIITETVFAWPGMGQLFLQSIQNADVPIMAAYLLLIASLFVVINLIVDLIYVAVDPRLRVQLHRAPV
jgi:peptide/nickel transport system permease protein